MTVLRPGIRFAAAHPAHAIALGFGAGLSPWAPGTAGTLLAWPVGWFLGDSYPPGILLAAIALLFLIGIAAIVGIVVTTAIGQPTVALIIALFAAAFFSRVAC